MKKFNSILMSIIMFFGLFSIGSFSSGARSEGRVSPLDKYDSIYSKNVKINGFNFSYRVIDNKYIEILDGEGFIPSEIEGLPVTIIGQYSYTAVDVDEPDGGVYDSELVIPDTVTTIGPGAFYSNIMTGVVIPTSVTSIEKGAFRGCRRLKSLTIPSGVRYVGEGTFSGCTALTQATINEGLKTISHSMFKDCINLKSVSIPASVSYIGEKAFYNCKKLKSVDISSMLDSTNTLEKKAFGYYLKGNKSYDTGKETVIKDFNLICTYSFSNSGTKYIKYALENKIKCTVNLHSDKYYDDYAFLDVPCGASFKLLVDGKKLSNLTSTKPKTVKVTESGKVTALKGGTAYIKGTLSNGKTYKKKMIISNLSIKEKAKSGKNKGKYVKVSSVTVNKGKTKTVKLCGKVPSINNKYTNTSYAKITSKKSADKLKIKGLKYGTTTLKIKVNGVKTLKLKVKVK